MAAMYYDIPRKKWLHYKLMGCTVLFLLSEIEIKMIPCKNNSIKQKERLHPSSYKYMWHSAACHQKK
jgi:hypothetical protein